MYITACAGVLELGGQFPLVETALPLPSKYVTKIMGSYTLSKNTAQRL